MISLSDDESSAITDAAKPLPMPGLSGIELQDRLVARGHRIPIIFITAFSDENVRMKAMKAGALAFLIKPFNYDHLIDYLEKALKAN